jgi:hypothetical protein
MPLTGTPDSIWVASSLSRFTMPRERFQAFNEEAASRAGFDSLKVWQISTTEGTTTNISESDIEEHPSDHCGRRLPTVDVPGHRSAKKGRQRRPILGECQQPLIEVCPRVAIAFVDSVDEVTGHAFNVRKVYAQDATRFENSEGFLDYLLRLS